ncbi:hypothetical protein WG66_006798 [Moniliophthora roreri]|nr:hypothetical protein WG66_006798 [Moniliophthora roreri]
MFNTKRFLGLALAAFMTTTVQPVAGHSTCIGGRCQITAVTPYTDAHAWFYDTHNGLWKSKDDPGCSINSVGLFINNCGSKYLIIQYKDGAKYLIWGGQCCLPDSGHYAERWHNIANVWNST